MSEENLNTNAGEKQPKRTVRAMFGGIRTKGITALILISICSVGIVGIVAQRSLTTSLNRNIGYRLNEMAKARATGIGQALESELKGLKVLALNRGVQEAAADASMKPPLSQSEIEQLDRQWRTADAANDDAAPLVASVLNHESASELRAFRELLPQHVEVFLTDVQGVSIASTNRTSDYYQADEAWWQSAYRDGLYIGQPEYDESSKTIAIIMAVSIRHEEKLVGVLRTTVNFTALTNSLLAGLFGETGRSAIYLPGGKELKLIPTGDGEYKLVQENAAAGVAEVARSNKTYQTVKVGDDIPTLASHALVSIPGTTGDDAVAITNLDWRVVAFQDQTEALRPVETQTRTILLIAIAILLGVTIAAYFLSRYITGPIVRLNEFALKVSAGDLTAQAPVETHDEVGTLAVTINKMVSQLRETLGSLEQRVAARTRALQTSVEVSRRLSIILDQRQLVREVVDQVQAAFNYYHTHIYLFDDAHENLVMVGGTGEIGQKLLEGGHKIPKGKGLVGRVADTNFPVLAPDVSTDPSWIPNPLLPDTRSEVAVPIAVSENVLGVLDVQQDQVGGLTQTDVDLLQSISNQVAVALQNARTYRTAQRQADREALLGTISQKIRDTTTVEDALKVAARELGRITGAKRSLVRLTAGAKAQEDDVEG